MLINPEFLFRVEPIRPNWRAERRRTGSATSNSPRVCRSSSGAAFPTTSCSTLAERAGCSDPEVLETAGPADARRSASAASSTNFAGQWLHLRNLERSTPDPRLFPDFDDNLREAFRAETELFFESVVREDRSVSICSTADYTFLNERLAKHYGIPNVYGSHFRRVTLRRRAARGGLLRQGSMLTVTSYATRTSPVIRGKWMLENILGAPPPPPPPNVPALEDRTVSAQLCRCASGWRQHRENPVCASCHDAMDPVGLRARELRRRRPLARRRRRRRADRRVRRVCPTAASSRRRRARAGAAERPDAVRRAR